MRNIKNILLIVLFAFTLGNVANAQEDCFPKKPQTLVNDYINVLSAQQRNALENKLVQFNNATTTQIAVVIVDDLCGYDKADYTTRLGEKWGVGQKGSDNGIMIMVKPVGGKGQRFTHIAVGYGLEGVIPDAIGKRIVENEMMPSFKNNDIYGGLDKATNVIMQLSVGEFSAKEYEAKTAGAPRWMSIIPFIIFIGIFLLLRVKGARSYSSTNNVGFWVALMMMSSASRSHGGSYNSFSSGSGGFGGGGFGGGFGGGGFGGGGAGGSW